MPTKIIRINNVGSDSCELEWCVGEKRMDKVIKLLDKVGLKMKQKESKQD